MKTLSKIATLIVAIFSLSSCVGKAESKLGQERNILWFSDDGKLQFTLEYDEVEDTKDGVKFDIGRGSYDNGGIQIQFMAYVNIPAYHNIFLMPLVNANDDFSAKIWDDNFPILLSVDFIRDIAGLFISDTTVLDGSTEYNKTDIAYFDDFDQKMHWEPLSEEEKNPLNYFMRTWTNDQYDLSFTQDSPKLFLEQKIRGTLADDSPVLLTFGNEDFTMCRYDDAAEGEVLLTGTYAKAVSSISLNVVTNNLYPENPGVIVLE